MTESKVPTGWIEIELGKIASVQSGGTPSRGNPKYWGGSVPWVKISDFKSLYVSETDECITEEGLKNSSARIFPSGTILLTIFATIGKVAILNIDAATNQAIAGITPATGLDSKFITYSLIQLANSLMDKGKGVAQKNINQAILKEAIIPFPPLAEQKRIVAKLDEAFQHLETLKAKLDRIPQLLKKFRETVLTHATTNCLKGTEQLSFVRGADPITIGLPDKQNYSSWKWTKLVNVAKLESGHTPRKSVPAYWENGNVPWLSLQDIRNAHGKVITETKFMPTMKGIENSSARLLPAGTVCFSRDISVGFTTIMGREMATTQHFANWICGDEIYNRYLLYAFMASQKSLIASGTGTTVGTIFMPALKEMYVLLPPIDEQFRIVERIDYLRVFKKQGNQSSASPLSQSFQR
jgi:type I restriction enzyme S subunit